MLQLRYRDVSNAREESNLMVDEEESRIVGREPFLVRFLFHSLVWFVAPFPLERSCHYTICEADNAEIPCCLVHHTHRV